MGSKKTAYSVTELFRLWAGGASYTEIAASLGVKESFVYTLRCRHKLPNRKRKERTVFENDPTPEEIEAGKAAVKAAHLAKRRGETEDETRKRVWSEDNAWHRRSSQSRA